MNGGKTRYLFDQLGGSLIEVMVSVAILGVVAVGAISVGDQVADQARMNRVGNNIFQIYDTVRARTFMEQDCTQYIRNANGGILNFDPGGGNPGPNTAGANGLNDSGQQIGISVPGANGIGESFISETNPEMALLGIQLTTLKLTNAMHIPDGDPAAPQHYLAYVEMAFDRGNGLEAVLGGQALYKKRIVTALFIETSAANPGDAAAIDSCRSASSDIDRQALCEGTPPNFDDGLGPKFRWDPVAEICIPPQEPLACPAGQVLTSIQGKTPVCVSLGIEDQICPSGQFAVQLGIGYIGCGTPGTNVTTPTPGGVTTDCPAQTITWTDAGNTCSTMTAFLTDGGTATITDPAPDPSGSVSVTCSGGSLIQSSPTCSGGTPPPPAGCTVTAGVTSWNDDGSGDGPCYADTSGTVPVGGVLSFQDTNANPYTGNVDFQCLSVGNMVPDTGTNDCSAAPPPTGNWVFMGIPGQGLCFLSGSTLGPALCGVDNWCVGPTGPFSQSPPPGPCSPIGSTCIQGYSFFAGVGSSSYRFECQQVVG